MYYVVILQNKDGYYEPHFGLFYKDKFEKAKNALETNNKKEIQKLLNDDDFIVKDGTTGKPGDYSPFIKILGLYS